MHRRDLLLQEMNIAQWVLRKPQVLKGDAQIRLDPQVKFVVICEEDYQHSPLFSDILRALALAPSQYQWFNIEQAKRLTFEHTPIFWQIGTQAVDFAKKSANCTAWRTENWQDLSQSAHKRQFWQQMQHVLQETE